MMSVSGARVTFWLLTLTAVGAVQHAKKKGGTNFALLSQPTY